MAIRTGIGWKLYIHGYDVSGDVGAIDSMTMGTATQDITNLTSGAMARLALLKDAEVSFTVFFNDTALAQFAALSTLPRTDVLAYVCAGTTAGDPVFAISAKQVNYDWTRNADGSLVGKVQLIGAAALPLEVGKLLTATGRVTHASATDATGIDGAAQSTVGAVGFLQHFSAASGTVEYDLEDSADSTNGVDGSWANLLAFADVATPYTPIGQRVAVNGTVERWTRASTNGTFTTAVFSMAIRRRATNDYDAA